MIHFGRIRPGSVLYIPFESFDRANGAPVTITGFTVGDIKVFKDGNTTARASTSGYVLLDTDGTDFASITGIHGFSIDLSDNGTAGFWACGSRYFVVVSTITVDSQTMSFLAASFTIGREGAMLDTTIATLASQTSFTLASGPAEDNALNGCVVLFHDVASAVQQAIGMVLSYTGSTKTVTLVAGPTYTIATTDNVSVFLPMLLPTTLGRTANIGSTGITEANVLQINANANAPVIQDRATRAITRFTIGAASTTTVLVTSSMDPAATAVNQFGSSTLPRVLIFDKDTTTANLRGQSTNVTASTVLGVLTVAALTDAPVSGDTGVIL